MGQSKSIFIADDDPDDLAFFEEALREICNKTILTTATDGVELLEILLKTVPPSPDVIFLDLNMPRLNGFECLIEIKNTLKLKPIPVVILSTTITPDTIDKLYVNGAHAYVTKPTAFDDLKSIIRHVLSIDLTLKPSRANFHIQTNG